MRSRILIFLLVLINFAIAACSKGNIQVASLGAVTGFSLQNTSIVLGSRAPTSITVNGNCSANTANIQVSFNEINWQSASALATTSAVNCASGGTFSFQYSAVAQPKFAIPNNQATTQVYFRATGSLGTTTVIPLMLSLSESNQLLTSGSSIQIQGGYTLRSRIVATPKVTANGYVLGR